MEAIVAAVVNIALVAYQAKTEADAAKREALLDRLPALYAEIRREAGAQLSSVSSNDAAADAALVVKFPDGSK